MTSERYLSTYLSVVSILFYDAHSHIHTARQRQQQQQQHQ